MVFSSTIFLFIFLPLVLGGYFLLKEEYRNVFLLLVSLAFYTSGEPKFVFVMIASILINYIAGLAIHHAKKNYTLLGNRVVLIIGVAANLGLLFYFKYLDFFIGTVNNIGGLNIPLKNIALPIGISFFTFQGMSYILDLYMGKVEVQKKFINIALYVSLFPQLIAGPIVRYKDVNDQIDARTCTVDKFAIGIRRFVVGLAKKVMIANQVGIIADQIFGVPANENTISIAWLGIICYTVQIYFDFSGYSDMAIGLGKMFGFDFLENFNYPYISTSVTEFWRRWHISLSSWFRDYIYIPLGGNRRGNVYFNLLVVFFVTGMWHGAAWNFIIWGLWHGMFLIIERIFKKKGIQLNIPKPVKWVYTMLIVLIGWVLFRSPDLTYAVKYVGVMFGISSRQTIGMNVFWYLTPKAICVLVGAFIAAIPTKNYIKRCISVLENTWYKQMLSNVYVIALFFFSIMLVMTSTYNPFIYFRF